MKIAVATNDNITITGHVGRCKAFIVFDVNEKDILSSEIRLNSFTHHNQLSQTEEHNLHNHSHEHGHGHGGLIEGLRDCSYVLFQGGGWRLVEDLKTNNITPVLTSEVDAATAVRKLIKGELVSNENNICRCH